MPAGDRGSIQQFSLWYVPVDVFAKLLSFCSELQELECHSIHPPQEVRCVHMYSVAWDALVFCTNHFLSVFDYDVMTATCLGMTVMLLCIVACVRSPYILGKGQTNTLY